MCSTHTITVETAVSSRAHVLVNDLCTDETGARLCAPNDNVLLLCISFAADRFFVSVCLHFGVLYVQQEIPKFNINHIDTYEFMFVWMFVCGMFSSLDGCVIVRSVPFAPIAGFAAIVYYVYSLTRNLLQKFCWCECVLNCVHVQFHMGDARARFAGRKFKRRTNERNATGMERHIVLAR